MDGNSKSLMPLFALWFIVSPILSTEETANPGVVYVMCMAVPLLVYGFLYTKVRITQYHVSAFLMFFFSLISTILGGYGVDDAMTFCKYLLFVLLFIYISNYSYSGKEVIKMTKFCVVLSFVVAIFIILSFFGGYQHVDPDADNGESLFLGRYSVGITGIYKNPNYLTSFINVATLVLSYKLLRYKLSKWKKILYLGLLSVFFVAIFLTGTRLALVLFVLIISLVYLSSIFYKKNKIRYIALPFLLILLVFFVFKEQIIDLFNLYLGTREMFSDDSRELAWAFAFSKLKENIVFGCGIGAWLNINHGVSYLQYLHNVFLEYTLNQGIIGLLLLLFTFFFGVNKTKKNDRFFLFMLMMITAIPLCFQNGVIAVNLWRFLIINRLAMNYSIYSKFGLMGLFEQEPQYKEEKLTINNVSLS